MLSMKLCFQLGWYLIYWGPEFWWQANTDICGYLIYVHKFSWVITNQVFAHIPTYMVSGSAHRQTDTDIRSPPKSDMGQYLGAVQARIFMLVTAKLAENCWRRVSLKSTKIFQEETNKCKVGLMKISNCNSICIAAACNKIWWLENETVEILWRVLWEHKHNTQ